MAILEAGHPLPFTVKAANLDLPELQGEPTEIAKEKCRLAAQQVRPHPFKLLKKSHYTLVQHLAVASQCVTIAHDSVSME